uniref:Hexosyltransferase n=1 Tax=Biomphalaria glabrata TaxID=6526 RepID=A0A2C9JQQ7_BIOGL
MKLKCLKLRRNVLLPIFGLNLICFMIIFLENVKFFQLAILTETKLPTTTALTAVPTTTTTINPTLARKLEKIKVDLNDSQLTQETMFPWRNIGRYLMLDPYLCKRGVESLDIILIVHTAPANLHRRQRIRETFGNESFFLPFRIRVAFLLGKTQNKTLERVLWFEHVTYNDTVMGDFLDSYYNLSIKGVMGYRWVSQYCSNSKYVFKIDDDVIVNMFDATLWPFRLCAVDGSLHVKGQVFVKGVVVVGDAAHDVGQHAEQVHVVYPKPGRVLRRQVHWPHEVSGHDDHKTAAVVERERFILGENVGLHLPLSGAQDRHGAFVPQIAEDGLPLPAHVVVEGVQQFESETPLVTNHAEN